VIPHAAAGTIGPLMIAMVQSAFPRALMRGLRVTDNAVSPRSPTGGRAVGVPAITRDANGEQRAAGAAHFLAERDVVHGVASAAATSPGRTRDSVAQIGPAASDVHGESEAVTRVRRERSDPHLLSLPCQPIRSA
jgi:hypothetical protein